MHLIITGKCGSGVSARVPGRLPCVLAAVRGPAPGQGRRQLRPGTGQDQQAGTARPAAHEPRMADRLRPAAGVSTIADPCLFIRSGPYISRRSSGSWSRCWPCWCRWWHGLPPGTTRGAGTRLFCRARGGRPIPAGRPPASPTRPERSGRRGGGLQERPEASVRPPGYGQNR